MRFAGGVDWPEWVDSLRRTEGPGEPNGAFVRAQVELVGEVAAEPCPFAPVSNLTAVVDLRLGDMDVRPLVVGVLEKLVRPEGGGNRSGRGNNGLLSFFRRFSLKNVVVVEMVCVVVVWAYTRFPLPSDLDESESLSTGIAS